MESIKHKLAILTVLLCLAVIAAAIWYCAVGFPGSREGMEGTLVEGFHAIEGTAFL